MLNRRGGELIDLKERPPPPVTVPEVTFLTTGPPVDDEPERREVAAKFLEARTVKAGVECWQAIGRAESFEAWVKIGKALQIGRDHSLKATGANRPMGQIYCKATSAWIAKHGFDRMPKSTRSVAIELAENIEAIEAWRDTLPERQRKRLISPLAVTRRWKAATGQSQTLRSQDLKRDAIAAWRRFVSCVEALPAAEARGLWATAQAQASEALCR